MRPFQLQAKENAVPTVAVLYKDEKDRQLWQATLKAIPALVSFTGDWSLSMFVERLRDLGPALRLVILSARLYPGEKPELAGLIRAVCPDAELLLISSPAEPSPSLMPLLLHNVRHLAINPPSVAGTDRGYLPSVVARLVERRPWDIASCLKAGTAIHSFQLTCSDDKERVIGALETELKGEGEEFEMLRQKGALLTDELLENAIYGAPRGHHGNKLFNKGEQRDMLPQEQIVFSFGFDGETLALKLSDSWGSLEPDRVMEYLAKNQEQDSIADDAGGRGLFIIWRFLDQFHVNVEPGQRTVVGGHLQLNSRLDLEEPRGFHISCAYKGEAA